MALPRKIQASLPLAPLELAGRGDRAGRYSIEELERLLQPLLAPTEGAEKKWPSGYGFLAAAAVSFMAWAAIAMAIWRMF